MLLILALCSLTLGCQSSTAIEASAQESPSPRATPTQQANIEERILADAGTWTSVDQAWTHLHPLCQEKLDPKERLELQTQQKRLLKAGQQQSWQLVEYQAPPSPSYTYPVPVTHLLKTASGIPVYEVAIEGQNWHLVAPIKTEAGKKVPSEYKLTDAEQVALAAKVVEELSPEQRARVVKAIQSKGKLAGIKALRTMSAHSLKVQKIAVESLMEEMQKTDADSPR